MTPQEFADLFPGRPFAIRHVERGAHGARKFGWHVMFTSDYWTSDSDREVYAHCPPSDPDGFGETLEEAFANVAKGVLERAEGRRANYEKLLEEAQQELAVTRVRLEGKTGAQ
jgi:nicotinamidase-related amidase